MHESENKRSQYEYDPFEESSLVFVPTYNRLIGSRNHRVTLGSQAVRAARKASRINTIEDLTVATGFEPS